MSLADELLADLEGLDEAGDERDEGQWQNEDKMEVIEEVQGDEAISDKSVKSITKLLDSKEVYFYRILVSLKLICIIQMMLHIHQLPTADKHYVTHTYVCICLWLLC